MEEAILAIAEIMRKREMKAYEIGAILREHNLNFSAPAIHNCIYCLTFRYPLYESDDGHSYKILTDDDLESYQNKK